MFVDGGCLAPSMDVMNCLPEALEQIPHMNWHFSEGVTLSCRCKQNFTLGKHLLQKYQIQFTA